MKPAPAPIALIGATAWAGPQLEEVRDAVVVVAEGKIIALGPAAEVSIPSDAEVIDAAGMTLLPGFIDAHVHIAFHPPAAVLAGGVTTVRDLGWPPQDIFPIVQASAEAAFEGPKVIAAGPIITAAGGYPARAGWAPAGTALEVSSEAEGRAAVAKVAELGATVIKVALNPPAGPTLPAAVLDAIVRAAHRQGLKVTGHVAGLAELEKAVDAGMDELAHMLMTPEAIPQALLERMAQAGMVIVPTLSVRAGADLKIATDNTRRFIAAGGKVVYGTDLGNAGPRPGIDEREVKAMHRAGMSTRAIVTSATVVAADHLGLTGTGRLQVGAEADIIGITGDIDDPLSLLAPSLVLRDGVRAR